VFPLPNFTGTVQSVTLRLEIEGYDSSQSSLSFSVHHVSTPVTTLVSSPSPWASIFDDLGEGTTYGSFTVQANSVNTVKSANLTSAITPVSTARGNNFAIGLLGPVGAGDAAMVYFSRDLESRLHQLEISVVP
jgi:hypothetical protein